MSVILGKTVNFPIYRGITFSRSFTYKASGQPVNLSGKNIIFYIRQKNSTTNYLVLNSSNAPTPDGTGVTIISEPNGQFNIKVANEDTALISFDEGTWYIVLDDGVDPKRIGGGTISVLYP